MDRKRRIRSKVAGVTHKNDDGSDRQKAIKRLCRADGELLAIPEQNRHAAGGVAVGLWVQGRFGRSQIGYVGDDLVGDVLYYLKAGGTARVRILDVTGGTWGKPTRGVNFEIELIPAGEKPAPAATNNPVPAPAPTSEPVSIRIGDRLYVARQHLLRAGAAVASGCLAAYRGLPGWAQPIAWGFGLGGVVVVIAILFRTFR